MKERFNGRISSRWYPRPRGELGVSAGLMHRFDGDFAVTAGVSYAGGKNTAVKAGVAGEF